MKEDTWCRPVALADNNNKDSNGSQPQFLYLDTRGWKTGKMHRIEIWFVELDGRYYVMSEHRERSHWVQNITHDPKISFSVYDKEFKGTARTVQREHEPGLARQVAELMSAKYRWDDGLIVELRPSA